MIKRILSYSSPYFGTAFILYLFFGCTEQVLEIKDKDPLFSEIKSNESGLTFSNTIQESDTLNYHSFPYIYMGGGVAIFDADNDGYSDIYVTGNMVKNKLYQNTGNSKFQDISETAGVQGDDRWYTGVTVVDINYDGYLDIYLSVSGKNHNAKNQLFVNNGDLTFDEKAAEYGIADTGKSIQSTFFDYDNDGDLDLFVANYPLVPLSQGNRFYHNQIEQNEHENSGHLYQNQGNSFVDVTEQAGLQNFGLTLGLSSADFNNDGWPDLYLSNDFNVPDYFYLNNGDGTFKEALQQAFGHTSMFGMGIDAADFNNDGLVDLVQADMTPEDYTRAKVNMASMSTASFWEGVNLGFHYQYMQNSLQLNNGTDRNGLPVFSEISRMAGVATTDWSWSTLFLDMDNDGRKDIYITNGMKRDVNDNDLNQRTGATTFKEAFKRKSLSEYPSEPLSNFAYRNKGDYTFENAIDKWGLNYEGFSNGMAYGDLDNDGDLDLVINNLDRKISLFENNSKNHFLRIRLLGPKNNPLGLEAKIELENIKTGEVQTEQLLPVRGFQSSVEPIAHFGLGPTATEQKITITWPDGKKHVQSIKQLDRLLKIAYTATDPQKSSKNGQKMETRLFTDIVSPEFRHQENAYDDYRYEPLLPHKYSTLGPGLAVADIDNNGLDDFYIGNAKNSPGKLFRQDNEGHFEELTGPWHEDSAFEDTGALFFDADNDGDKDLYVVSGGYERNVPDSSLQDRLYLNINGKYSRSAVLPNMPISGQAVAVCDYDKDGDDDIFVGGRIVPGAYPKAPRSYLLENKGGSDTNLKFQEVTDENGSQLSHIGMVTDALWVDVDGDSWKDLIVAGEWMPITLFRNKKGKLVEETEAWGLDQNVGWWYALETIDMDNDGDKDIVAGNLGLNYKYKASPEKPFEVFMNDFDQNGKQDIVLGVHKEGRLLPLRGRECSSEQIPAIQAKFGTYREFASADLSDIYGTSMLKNSLHYQANTFSHYWLENNGAGEFLWHSLPKRSQLSPINTILSFDYDGDDYKDLLVIGSLYDAEIETPRADAGVGLVLRNKQGKGFEAIEPRLSGLMIKGSVKTAKKINYNGKPGFVIAKNNDSLELRLFQRNKLDQVGNGEDFQ